MLLKGIYNFMKFTEGTWSVKKGYTIHNQNKPYEIIVNNKSLCILTPVANVNSRANALGGPVLQIIYSSPTVDVIRVEICHFKGTKNRFNDLLINNSNNVDIKIIENERNVIFSSGELSIEISKENGWETKYTYSDKYLTGNRLQESEGGVMSRGYITDSENQSYISEELQLSVGEHIYGFGEKFTNFVKNGQSIDTWNYEAGTSSSMSYKNIPFYISDRKYGVLVNSTGNVSFEVGSDKVSKVQFSVKGECLDYYIVGGKTLANVLHNYSKLTGKPSLPPAWSFGLWLTTSFSPEYNEEIVLSMIDQMAQNEIPLHVFHFDCFWMKPYHWCDFTWDLENFPDPEGMIKKIKLRGIKICLWINPYISQYSSLFEEGKESKYFLCHENGDVWQSDMWQPGIAFVDFSNPEACKWYSNKLEVLLEMGIDSFKTDFGEMIPTDDVCYFNGSAPELMHNFYSFLYNRTVFELLEKKFGKGEAVVFARSATLGGQRFPVHWGGDCYCTYESMAESLRGGLSLGLSGYGFWSHDIGGFGGFHSSPEPDLYKRWFAFGLLSSHSRLHGNVTRRVPWDFGDEAVLVARFFTKLKCQLMPYIFQQAVRANKEGMPLMRPMILEFEDDPTCKTIDTQYMLGGALLVAPIFNKQGEVSYYVPKGEWTRLLTGETVCGEHWYNEIHDFMSLPVLVRENSVIPMGSSSSEIEYDYADNVILHVYNLKDQACLEESVFLKDGTAGLVVKIKRDNQKYQIEPIYANKPWSVMMHNVLEIEIVQNASLSIINQASCVMPISYLEKIVFRTVR